MSGFVIFEKFTVDEALKHMAQIESWFRAHPTRKVVRTDLFPVRRGHVVEDILRHTEVKDAQP